MKTINIGNYLNQIVYSARASMFDQGELAQLTYGAFDIAASSMRQSGQEEIEVTFPVAYKPDRTAVTATRKYNQQQLLGKYQFLAFHQLSINGILQLVILVEAMLSDVLRAVIVRYPHKIGGKRVIQIQSVLESSSLEDVHIRATDALLNELSYKSPSEFAEAVGQILSINLLECPSFHRYLEIKATRDIFIHNRGITNEVYERKSGAHARAKSGQALPADIQYFMESYEHCLQVADWLEEQLHEHWHSSDYEERKQPQMEIPLESTEPESTL